MLSVVERDFEYPNEAAPQAVLDQEPLAVLKFGSSVLRHIADLASVAGEIYRQRRNGFRVIAVVSALGRETDRLFEEASHACGGTSCRGIAELVSLGEERTAALLGIACDRIGLCCTICRAEELGLKTVGGELDADFAELRPAALKRKLEAYGVVIVPGFVGTNAMGERTLLGRGGSDFTAAILGGELGAKTIRLYKDVDGVFEADPAVDRNARKFDQIGYDDALEVARPLVQPKAVEFAAARGLAIEVETIGSSSPTRIGARCRLASAKPPPLRLRVALAGYGIVGQALARRLQDDPHFEISAILVRNLSRHRNVAPPVKLTNDPAAFAGTQADILVELLSCAQTGASLCCDKLEEGIPVVTASKRLVSEHFAELTRSARAGGTEALYSGAAGGSAPLLETIERAKRFGVVEEVSGILNGTVNYVLGRLAEGMALDAALAEARDAGFAEEDCEADVSGADAAAKLRIAAYHAFGVFPQEIRISAERLDQERAKAIVDSGERWIQLSQVSSVNDKVRGSVSFVRAAATPIGRAGNEWNAAAIRLAGGRELTVHGRGAGGAATAEAVLADLYDLLHRFPRPWGDERLPAVRQAPGRHRNGRD